MKKKKYSLKILAFLIAICTFCFGCQHNDAIYEVDKAAESRKMHQHLVDAMGFPETQIVETEDYFVVEGDILFTKDRFWEDYGERGNALNKNYRSTYLVYPTPKNVKVYAYSAVPNNWKTALNGAIAEWNALCGRITFSSTSNLAIADVTLDVYAYNGVNSDYAYASLPTSNRRPGLEIILNSNCTYYNLLSTATKKKRVMMHELGHVIGLRHTNDATLNSNLAITTSSSACNSSTGNTGSLMTAIVPSTGFTQCDILAFNTIYP